ncbi:MAG: CcmD family protein [Niabella sp.]|nr:CcmD family protein [Niabella sp.]
MKTKGGTLLLLSLFLLPNFVWAQSGVDSLMRSSGRIYVVVAVLLIILLGVFFYLLGIERRLKKLEAQQKD